MLDTFGGAYQNKAAQKLNFYIIPPGSFNKTPIQIETASPCKQIAREGSYFVPTKG